MIPVQQKPEPASFQANVRAPGRAFLAKYPRPTKKQYGKERARYCVNARGDLHTAYGGMCAYSAQWMPLGDATVDHYIPKSHDPNLAFEWSNYRLSRDKLNHHKADSLDVMDPFKIKPDWFIINFTNFHIEPNPGL